MQHTLSLLGTLTELQPGLSEVMLSSPGLGPALEFSLLHTPERLVRKEVSAGVLRMAISLRSTSKVCHAVWSKVVAYDPFRLMQSPFVVL